MSTTDELAQLEDLLGGLAERYRTSADACQAACEQVRVMRETVEFAHDRQEALEGAGLVEVRAWLQKLLPGAAK